MEVLKEKNVKLQNVEQERNVFKVLEVLILQETEVYKIYSSIEGVVKISPAIVFL